jgi:hypothetical protein
MHNPAFREYTDVMAPAKGARATIGEIELLAQTFTLRIFVMRTKCSLDTVLSDGYFNDITDVHFRKEDRIEIVANFDGVGEHALLVVDAVDKATGRPKVSLLQKYER